jgi:hypothetical protein
MNLNGTIVRDTVDPAGIAPDASFQAILPYRDGFYRWPVEQVQRFRTAGKHIIPVTVTGANPHLAQVADCERGDLTPAGAAQWARERNRLHGDAAHGDATVYVSLGSVPELLAALGPEPCWLWIAWWQADGRPRLPQLELPPHIRLAAVQYASHPAYDESKPAYDESKIVSAGWPAHPFTMLDQW